MNTAPTPDAELTPPRLDLIYCLVSELRGFQLLSQRPEVRAEASRIISEITPENVVFFPEEANL